jgi:hypothetical protein
MLAIYRRMRKVGSCGGIILFIVTNFKKQVDVVFGTTSNLFAIQFEIKEIEIDPNLAPRRLVRSIFHISRINICICTRVHSSPIHLYLIQFEIK